MVFARSRILSRLMLLFWAVWFSVVWASNMADGLQEAGVLPPSWRFTSGNFALVADSLVIYSLSRMWADALFVLVLVIQLAAAFLFWRATLEPDLQSPGANSKILQAFFVGVGWISAFLVCDEVLLIYRRVPTLETTHFVILCALLLSFLVINLSGDREQAA